MWGDGGTVNKPIVIAAIGAVVVALALGWNVIEFQQESKPAAPEPAPVVQDEQVSLIPPTFDVVRVNPRGDTVIAGRAQPGSTIEILDGNTVIGTVVADDHGEWVFVPETPLAAGERQLGLRMLVKGHDAIISHDVVILTVPENATQPLAVITARDGSGGSRVLQRPTLNGAVTISVDAVDYSADGITITISGRAPENGSIQLYLDNTFIGRTISDANGHWTTRPSEPITPGVYTLRADLVDQTGKVLSRIEVPFSRATIEAASDLKPGTFIVVQPGNSLWRLARRTYGEGTFYTDIFDATRDQIRNADLIYPGQVITLPKAQ